MNVTISCPSGYYSTGKQSVCTPCTAGYKCISTTSAKMTPCQAGFYSTDGSDSCRSCPAGYYCPSRSSGPTICPAGSYSVEGAITCTLAAAGYFVDAPGRSSADQCPFGHYSSGGAIDCIPCSPGYYCSNGSTEPSPSDSPCPIGSYCNPAYVVTPCPAGTYGITAGGVSQSQACAVCEPGYTCPSPGTIRSTRIVCPAGGMYQCSLTYC